MNIVIDGHCDSLEVAFDNNISIYNNDLSFNVKDALKNLPYIQFLASFIHTKYDTRNVAFKRVNDLLDKFYLEYEKNKDDMYLITSKDDLNKEKLNNKLGIILTIENGVALSNDLSNLEKLYNRGIRVMSLTWNDDNFLGCGAKTKNDTGITKEGIKCIEKMEKLGIILDVSHASRKTFFDAIKISTKSIIATHSCVYNLCENDRNLTDEQIKLIAKSKGVIGVCLYNKFLSNKNVATIDDVINHIEYISNLVGTEYVGIGSDFDGIDKTDIAQGITGVIDIRNIEEKLKLRGFSKEEVWNIMGGNYIRVLNENLK